MWGFIHKAASPRTSFNLARWIQPWAMLLCLVALTYGLIGGLYLAPPDYQQGDVFRIIYIHVPDAILSLFVYGIATVAVIVYFVWRIKLADMIARLSMPIGAWFTLLTLITGAIWGKPTWGTYWIWGARLTSELILLFIYIAIIALRAAITDPKSAAKAAGILTIVCAIDLPIIHYSVDWWHTLHQGATLKLSGSTIAPSMLYPLLAMMLAFFLLYIWYMCLRVKAALLEENAKAAWVKAFMEKKYGG